MTKPAIALLLLLCQPAAGVVVDRIAVIVDKRAIKTSDIDRDVRVTEFLNRQPLDTSVDARKKAADRLVVQTVIREEMEKGGYTKSTADELDGMVTGILNDRFGGSDARLRAELARYGLTEPQLRMQLQWQLDVLKFMDERFRPGIIVTDDQVRDYYGKYKTQLERNYPQLKTFEAMEPKIRAILESDQLSRNFDEWLEEARKRDRIVYRQEAFQ